MRLQLKEWKIGKKIYYILVGELEIENEDSILSQSDLNDISPENFPSLDNNQRK